MHRRFLKSYQIGFTDGLLPSRGASTDTIHCFNATMAFIPFCTLFGGHSRVIHFPSPSVVSRSCRSFSRGPARRSGTCAVLHWSATILIPIKCHSQGRKPFWRTQGRWPPSPSLQIKAFPKASNGGDYHKIQLERVQRGSNCSLIPAHLM